MLTAWIVEDDEDRDCTILVASFDTSVDDIILSKNDHEMNPVICVMDKL